MKNQEQGIVSKVITFEMITIVFMLSQLLVKIVIEFPYIAEIKNPELPLQQGALIMTAGWLILVPLCVMKHRKSFYVAGLWGIGHAIFGIAPPVLGACNHFDAGTLVGVQGLIIAVFSFLSYRKIKQFDTGKELIK